MIKSRIFKVIGVIYFGLLFAAAFPANADTLWYNGDPDAGGRPTSANGEPMFANALFGGRNYLIYDDFVVSNSGMTINTVWAKTSLGYGNYQAFWEIRTGVVVGTGYYVENSGSIVANSGSVVPWEHGEPIYVVPGFVGDDHNLKITGLNISLEPGTYWLCVAPFSSMVYSKLTMGANAIGEPPGNNGNSFVVNGDFSQISPTRSVFGPYDWDFSMGVAYDLVPPPNPVPLPSAVLLLGSGLLRLAWYRRRKKS